MSTTFTRTSGGLSEKWRFYAVPTIWVEGITDVFFYEPITEKLRCRIEPFHGTGNAKALVKALSDYDYPYLVILDGEYSILKFSRSPHKHVLVLPRHSFENFLWEQDAVNRACLRHAQCGEDKDVVGFEMERVASHFKTELQHLIALDIAARNTPSPPSVIPDAAEQLLTGTCLPDVDLKKVAALVAKVEPLIDKEVVKKAQAELNCFLGKRCIMHLLKGHIVLGVLRRIFVRAASRESGSTKSIHNDALTQILSDMVWRRCKSVDHKNLKRKVRRITRRLSTHFPVITQPTV
jgi:hypothetical protein